MDNTLEKVYKAGLKFLVPLTPEELYRTIVHEAVNLVDGDGGTILLEEGGELRRVYRLAVDGITPPDRVRKRGFAYRAFRERKVLVVHAKKMVKIYPEIVRGGIRSSIFIPLAYRNKSIGVLFIRSHKTRYFTGNEPDILKLFGSIASLAVRKTQLYDETKKALEARDLFLSMAAHELRTPLTTIGGYTQLLASKLPKDSSAQSRWVEELSWETNRLTALVNELLEVSRMRGGRFQYVWRECRLIKVIEKAIDEFYFSYPKRKLYFNNELLDGEDVVVGDFDKLLQVFINLMDNAAKFSTLKSEVMVKLKFKSPNLIITVKDMGLGISSNDMPKIFEGYYRGDKTSSEGMGLGLFLAKNIITHHHGSIAIRSKIGKGTTVEVKLPRAKL